MHHRDGGSDPTELVASAQPALNRPTGACHTNHIIPPSRLCAAESFLVWGAVQLVCGTCMDARGIIDEDLAEGCLRSTLAELTEWTQQADRALVF